MTAVAGFTDHHRAQELTGTTAKAAVAATTQATGSSSSSSSSTSSADGIGANDFLTLLVTEMQNQDPTADNDPNQYITQLVQVNSLEQLISMNQNLSTALGISGSSTGTTGPNVDRGSTSEAVNGKSVAGDAVKAHTEGVKQTAGGVASRISSALKLAPGNLSVPDPSAAAQRVGQSLGTHSKRNINLPAL
jgi:flagellar basal-body rod modification protein FlgD